MKRFVLVSGDFTTFGGMDRANYELAWHLADRAGAEVHIVAYHVQLPLADHPNLTWHRVHKPLNSYMLAEGVLRRAGKRVARSMPDARVIVNGGNCDWPDVNWIHALHAAWGCRHESAPLRFRMRANYRKWRDRTRERHAVRKARIVFTNSQRTRRQAIDLLGLDPRIVHAVYYGIDGETFRPAMPQQRAAARAALSLPADKPVIAFIGTLGFDRNKGFDTLFRAQRQLCEDAGWDAIVVAAGAGADVEHWREEAAAAGIEQRVRMLGFTKQVPELLAATDILVAPSSYESYGLAVHEALCREIPVIVSGVAGVAERYPAELADWLLPDATDASDLANRLKRWHDDPGRHRDILVRFGQELRATSWEHMATRIVELIEQTESAAAGTALKASYA